jgi:hypothetical protein
MKTGKKIIVLTVLVFIFLPVFVHAVSWWPLVPCGTSVNPTPCNRCDLLKLLKNIIDFTLIGLMPPAAAILFVWGGFLILMGGANPGLISKGKSIFWNTAVGVAIISASWMITNTIIKSIANESITNPTTPWYQLKCQVIASQPPAPQPPQPSSLAISTSSLSDATQGTAYSQSLSASGGTTPYVWSISSGALPAGLSISGSNISGTPTATGTSTFTIKAEDSSSPKKSATKELTIKVATQAASVVISNVASSNVANTSATITWTTDKPSTSQVAYGTTTAYGPPTPLNSSQVTGHSVTLTGLNPGTTYNYQVISSVTGFTARSSNYTFKTTGTAVQLLAISTSSLSDATQNTNYSQSLSASGGTTPYVWSISSGALPAGLSISGSNISGTPTATGTSTFTIKAEDSSSPKKSATKELTIKVNQTSNICLLPAQLAKNNNEPYPVQRAPELNTLFSCISGKLKQSLPSEGGVNAYYGSMYTYDGSAVLCNYARGQKTCIPPSCSHAVNSCHYGGKTGTAGSLAVDFGNELNGNIIIQAAISCGVPVSKARCENVAAKNVGCAPGSGANHIHISASTCDAN